MSSSLADRLNVGGAKPEKRYAHRVDATCISTCIAAVYLESGIDSVLPGDYARPLDAITSYWRLSQPIAYASCFINYKLPLHPDSFIWLRSTRLLVRSSRESYPPTMGDN